MISVGTTVSASFAYSTIGTGQLVIPSGFTFVLPFNVSYIGGVFTTDINSDDYKITPTNTYYISPTGSSGNTGLTAGSPKASPNQAIALGNASGAPFEIQAADGTYPRNKPWTTSPTQDFNIIASSSAIFSSEWETKTGFTLTTTNTYRVARSAATSVYDAANSDSDGDYEKLTLVASQAICEAAAGTWYTDNSNVWVHASDDRDLSADASDIKIMLQSGYPRVAGDIHGYVENCHFEGWQEHAFDARNSGASQTPQLYFKECSFKYSPNGNGMNLYGVSLCVMDSCVAAKNNLDGFNYHALNSVKPDIVEINCQSRSNGYSGSTSNNASTGHDGGRFARFNGEYKFSEGRNIHDIDDGTESLNCGVSSHSSRDDTDSGSINFFSGDGAPNDTTKMWLINCTSFGSRVDVRVEDDSIISINEGSNIVNGTRVVDATGTIETFKALTE